MPISSDFSVASNGNIRHISGTTVYSVLDLHAWLQDLADDAAAGGDDLVSILTSNPSKLDGPRATNKPMVLNLLGSYNIDDTASQFINFGSISQWSGNVLYTGLKTIGSPLVAASPMYVVQNGSKITKFWSDWHIQILVKAKTWWTLIDNWDVRVFSRKYWQTYADFAANLTAWWEQPAAISTQTTDWTPLSLGAALALSGITISVWDVNFDTGDWSWSKLYKWTITLSGGRTIAEAAQYCQAICNETSAITINGEAWWKYRALNVAYTPNSAAPFGAVAGWKWFVAQWWLIQWALAGDSQKYQMISHDWTTVTNPVVANISIWWLESWVRVLVWRDNGSGGIINNEYTLASATTSWGNTCVVNEAISTDTPSTWYIRVNNVPYEYTALNRWTKTFTITGTWWQIHAISSPVFCPFIDKVSAGTSELSPDFTFSSNFTARVKARKWGAVSPKKPFETTFAVTSAGGSTNAILDADD